MKIAVSANGTDLEAAFVPFFGRCPYFVIGDTETLSVEAVPNEAMGAAGGAGIQAAQTVAGLGAEAVVTGSVGPNAYRVLASATVAIYPFVGKTVREALSAFQSGRLAPVAAPTGPAHAGMGMKRGVGR